MNKLLLSGLAALLIAVPAAAQLLGTPGGDQAFSRNFAMGGGKGYLMMPPVLVSGPSVEQADWSLDGKYVALRRVTSRLTARQLTAMLDPKPGQDKPIDAGDYELLIYSRQGKLYPIWKAGLGRGSVVEVTWLEGGVLMALTERTGSDGKPELVYIASRPSGSGFATTSLPRSAEWRGMEVSPTSAAAVVDTDQGICVVRTAGQDSLVSNLPKLPNRRIVWSADGAEPYVEAPGEGDAKVYYAFFGSELAPMQQAPELYSALRGRVEPAPRMELVAQQAALAHGTARAAARSLWLEVPEPDPKAKPLPGLVCGDAVEGWLSPSADAALYITADGAAFIRGIVPVDPALVTEARDRAMRATVLSWSKQIGQALVMFAADNQDRLPPPAEFADKLKLYLRDDPTGMLQLFQYTCTADSLDGMANPGEAILGYLPGPGGMAVVYADGHAAWKASAAQ